MFDLDNVIVFEPKRMVVKKSKENDVYFSITKSKRGYCSVRFYVGTNIAKELSIDENSKLKLGLNKENKSLWYILSKKTGSKVTKEKKNDAYSFNVKWPFNFIDKKMTQIKSSKCKVYKDEKVILLDTSDAVKQAELI